MTDGATPLTDDGDGRGNIHGHDAGVQFERPYGSLAAATTQGPGPAVALPFSADPIERWLYPDSRQYLVNFPIFVRAFAGRAFQNASAFVVDDYAGAALWLPPSMAPFRTKRSR